MLTEAATETLAKSATPLSQLHPSIAPSAASRGDYRVWFMSSLSARQALCVAMYVTISPW